MKKKLIFAIRDDDVSFFTSPEKYEEFCSKYIKNHSLISGIILNQKGSPSLNIPTKYWYTELNYNIEKNSGICKLLSDLDNKNNFFPAIHGYEHNYLIKDNTFVPELRQKKASTKLNKNLDIGEKFFLKTFQNPQKLFIPPSNTISANCASILFKRNYTLFNYPGIFRRSRDSIKGYKVMIERIMNIVFKRIDLQKPYYENKFSKCFNAVPLTSLKSEKQLNKFTNYCSEKGYPLIISMHQWELDFFKPYSEIKFLEHFLEIIRFLELKFELVNFNPNAEIIS